jgi:hypothetical protein
MAKKSKVAAQLRRERTVQKHAARRAGTRRGHPAGPAWE